MPVNSAEGMPGPGEIKESWVNRVVTEEELGSFVAKLMSNPRLKNIDLGI